MSTMPPKPPLPPQGVNGRICETCTMPALHGYAQCLKCLIIRRLPPVEPMPSNEDTQPVRVRVTERLGIWTAMDDTDE